MSARQDFPGSHTGQPLARETVQQELSSSINLAIRDTTEGLSDENKANAQQFLPRSNLESILKKSKLEKLFRELHDEYESRRTNPTQSDVEIEMVIEHCVKATIGNNESSKRPLLALFLYQMRTGLLRQYINRLTSDNTDLLRDASLPLDESNLDRLGIDQEHHDYILKHQYMFVPVTIRKDIHQTFWTCNRLPYLGEEKIIKHGSSGIVYERRIAPRHWEYEASDHLPETLDRPMVVALKIFKAEKGFQTAGEAAVDFNIERKLLDELKEHNFSHKMIMLDWGSFTVEHRKNNPDDRENNSKDMENNPEHHALIFELAKFSLEAFLDDYRCYENYVTKSFLLTKLVDIVGALDFLHETLKYVHLDIKPENILVFERDDDLIWKLTDFGLARRIDGASRTGERQYGNTFSTISSTVTATRPAGLYQAPEIQEAHFSEAGTTSDVWSMGCVCLMVLAFMRNGPQEVRKLSIRLEVVFNDSGGAQNLFYIRSDSSAWQHKGTYRYKYLNDLQAVSAVIPGTQPELEASVNPYLIEWSNELHNHYRNYPEQSVIKEALATIFREVLLIERKDRIKASDFHKRLGRVRQGWKTAEAEERERAKRAERPHHDLCLEMKCKKADIDLIRDKLAHDPALIKDACPNCEMLLMHLAMRNNQYEALGILLEKADPSVINVRCSSKSGNRTALEEACLGTGNARALRHFLSCQKDFPISKETYKTLSKKGLSNESRKLLDRLYHRTTPQPTPQPSRPNSPRRILRKYTSNNSFKGL